MPSLRHNGNIVSAVSCVLWREGYRVLQQIHVSTLKGFQFIQANMGKQSGKVEVKEEGLPFSLTRGGVTADMLR